MTLKQWDLALQHFEKIRRLMPEYVEEKLKEIEKL
jgi:hypothetical protein